MSEQDREDPQPSENVLGAGSDPEGAPTIPVESLLARAVGALGQTATRARRRIGGGYGEIWDLAWPVMLSQVLASLVGIVDIAMVGRLGPGAVAAVGYATQFFFIAQSALIAVGFACVAVAARAVGSGDRSRAKRGVAASLFVGVLTAAVLIAPFFVAPRFWLELLSADPEVAELCVPYMRLLLGASVLFAASIVLDSALRADRDTATPMRIAALATAVKIVLNLVLIFGLLGAPRLELLGAGIATVVSQVIAVLCYLAIARSRPHSTIALTRADLAGGRAMVGEVGRIALPGVLERVILNMALLSYFSILGAYGTVAVAAYTVGVRILSFSWIPGTGYAAAVATLVGQNLGAGRVDKATAAGWRGARLALITAVILGAVFAAGRFRLAELFIEDPETIATLGPFMLCVALAQPVLQVHFTLGGAHRGAGDTWTPLMAATVGNWVFRVPLAVLFGVVLRTELVWVWVALIVDHTARAIWLTWTFHRGDWRRASLRAADRAR